MKKLIFTLSTLFLLSSTINAQSCGAGSSIGVSGPNICGPRPATGEPGLTPEPDSLPCILRGTPTDQIIYFENFDTFRVSGNLLTINELTIKQITNLPAGLCWSTNKPNNNFSNKESGCIRVVGTTTAPIGQYKLRIIVDVNAGGLPLLNQDAEAIANLRFYVRVGCVGGPCPAIDSAGGVANSFIAYNFTCPFGVGIDEDNTSFTNLSVVPNPFSASALVKFTAANDEPMTVKLSNILGATVMTKSLNVVSGANEFTINRAGYAPGVYLLSLTNGKATQTRRVVIE